MKAQQTHFDKVEHGIKEPAPKPHVLDAMQHGLDNELHAIGTLVSKVLRPNYVFHEIG